MNLQEQADPTSQATLESWKEIAAYLRRDAKTARKWEKEEGLPVHRHTHKSRSSVYAYPGEIDRWRATRKVAAEPVARPLWKIPAFAVTMSLCLVMVGNGVRPQVVEAQQGQTRNLVCSGVGSSTDCEGEISPDGKSLLVISVGGLAIQDIGTKKVRKLVEAATGVRICCTEFSPDGSRIAYTRQQPSGPPEEVLVTNVDGTRSHTIYRGGSSYAWSPDGKRLLIGESGQPTHIISLLWVDEATGKVQKLPTTHPNLDVAKVSPDGKHVAFNASTGKDAEENVYIVASDGSGETLVTRSAAYQEPIAWTPDGKYLVFAQFGSSASLWAAPVVNGKIQGAIINTHAGFEKGDNLAGVSRSGAIYYRTLSRTSDIYTATMDTASGMITAAPVPVPVDRAGQNVLPRWAPDSLRLAYNWRIFNPDRRELSIYSFATGKEQRLGSQPSSYNYCWNTEGTSILFNSGAIGTEVSRFDLATSQVTKLLSAGTTNLRSCSSNLAVGMGPAFKLQVRNLGTGSEKDIYTFKGSQINAASLSHDGRNVAFVEQSNGGFTLLVASSNGGPSRDLANANSPAELPPGALAWSPDDRFVYFTQRPDSHSPTELFRVAVTGGAAQTAGLKIEELREIDIAPDGTHIAFSVGRDHREIWAIRNFLPAKK